MRDAELLVRYYAFKNFLNYYTGNLKEFLDKTCEAMNNQWQSKHAQIQEQLVDFEEAHKRTSAIFGGKAYRKWVNNSYESRFNRAIFDIMIFYFSRSDIRAATLGSEAAIEAAFKELCGNTSGFLNSIEQTTKSIPATVNRLNLWGTKLNEVLNQDFNVPTLESGRGGSLCIIYN